MNGLKGSTKIQNIQSQFKYQSRLYNVQRNPNIDHRGIKMIRNNKLFPSLNVINGKTFSYASKGILRHYHYWYDPKLVPGIVAIRRISCSCHACTDILSLSCDPKTKEAVNQPIYGKVYNCKYSQILGCHNNLILMNFLDGGTNEEYYKNINWNILDNIVMNTSLIINEGKYCAIDTDDSLCHGY